jgi:ferredoxin
MVYMKNVSTLKIDKVLCTGCGRCTEVCPREVFTIENRKASITNLDNCLECGACMNNCAFKALNVKSGVGCAAAMVKGLLKYGDMDKGTCGCENGGCC